MSLKIKKILNNNAVIVRDGNEEKVAIGTGVAFNKRKNDFINPNKVEKLFVMEEKEKEKFQQLLNRIPEEHFLISEHIISFAERQIGTKLNEHIHITLTDHISFTIEREAEGIHVKNKLLHEIKILYKQEYEIGLWAVHYMKEKLNIDITEDEAAFIALHIHTMKPKSKDLKETIYQTTMIKNMVDMVKQRLSIEVEEDDLAYHRLITHLRYALVRADQYEIRTLDDEMITMIRQKFPTSFECARYVAKELSNRYNVSLPEQELAYITLHIERLRKREL